MYLHGVGTRVFDRHGLYSKKATKKFIDEIDKLDIGIFHLLNIHWILSSLFQFLFWIFED